LSWITGKKSALQCSLRLLSRHGQNGKSIFSISSKIKSKFAAVSNVYQVGEFCRKLIPDYSLGSLFKRKVGNSSRKKTESSLTEVERILKLFHSISNVADQLQALIELKQQARTSEGITAINQCTLKSHLEILLAEAQLKDFTKDQILQRLNEIVYPERESGLLDSSRDQDVSEHAKTPPQLKTNFGIAAFHPNKPKESHCSNSKTSINSEYQPPALPHHQDSKLLGRLPPSSVLERIPEPQRAQANSVNNYEFGPVKLIKWVKTKFFQSSKSQMSAMSNTPQSSKKRRIFAPGYKKASARPPSDLPLAERKAKDSKVSSQVNVPDSFEVTTFQQIKEKVEPHVGELREVLRDGSS